MLDSTGQRIGRGGRGADEAQANIDGCLYTLNPRATMDHQTIDPSQESERMSSTIFTHEERLNIERVLGCPDYSDIHANELILRAVWHLNGVDRRTAGKLLAAATKDIQKRACDPLALCFKNRS